MKAEHTTFEISSFVFENNDPEVLVKGSMIQGNLSYDTELLVTQTQLNMIINELLRKNTEMNSESIIETSIIDSETKIYFGDFQHLTDRGISLNTVNQGYKLRQIRA